MKRPLKPVVITKRQLDNALVKLFDQDSSCLPRTKMSTALYEYAWTVWAKRQGADLNQGKRAAKHAKRRTVVKP